MHPSSHTIATWLATLALLVALFGAMPGQAQTQQAVSGDILGPGDSVRVTVFQNPDLTTETRLSSQGAIWMPLVGLVDLKGLSPVDAAARIAHRYQEGQYLRDPQINVSLLQVRSRQVSVLGQVVRPGRYPLDDSSTRLTDVLAQAGGIAPGGGETVTVITQRDGQPARFQVDLATMYRGTDASANMELVNGDTVYVQRAPVFYIYGEVQRAGAYRIDGNLSVMQALSLGGGVTLRGTERGMKIHRREADGTLSRIDARPSDLIQADDVIYVSESLF